MRTILLAVLLLVLTACGSEPPGPADPAALPSPSAVPAASGEVRTRTLVTVMDTGKGPELCLGAIAESYPPQCGGPPLRGWRWEDQERGTHDTSGNVRWGEYALVGRWDGTAFRVTKAVPAALYDAATPAPEPTTSPGPGGFDPQQLDAELRRLPGYLGSYEHDGRMLVDVIHDDGSIQAWLDQEYGAGLVRVTSALVDAS